jgi:lipid II:glycine glycyltransferase (peptidoglycan interpeptide bridge formation enzyme)
MKFYRKVSFLKTYQYWFKGDWKPYHFFTFAAFLHIKTGRKKKLLCFQENSYTLELDLQQDLTIIYSNFAKQVRQQTTQATNEGVTFHIHNDFIGFKSFFNEFAVKKEIFSISERRLKEMEANIHLVYAKKNGDILAAHSYLYDKEVGIVSHLHSASRRLDDRYDAKIIGKANKFLTCKSIEYFKNDGYSIFDFGGIRYPMPENSNNGINNYKMLFGGKITVCYNSFTPFYYLLKQVGKKVKFFGKKASL